MTEFIAAFIELIESELPQLVDKIQHGAVDAEIQPPYAAYSVPASEPIRTIHGIVGYTTTFELIIVDRSLAQVDELSRKIIRITEITEIADRRCRLSGMSTDFFEAVSLNGIILTFKIL